MAAIAAVDASPSDLLMPRGSKGFLDIVQKERDSRCAAATKGSSGAKTRARLMAVCASSRRPCRVSSHAKRSRALASFGALAMASRTARSIDYLLVGR